VQHCAARGDAFPAAMSDRRDAVSVSRTVEQTERTMVKYCAAQNTSRQYFAEFIANTLESIKSIKLYSRIALGH
jgi:hypothetical protein